MVLGALALVLVLVVESECKRLQEPAQCFFFRAFFEATAFVACFPAMAALGDPLHRKVRAMDRGAVFPDSDRQEWSHRAGPRKPKQHWPLALGPTLALGLEPKWLEPKWLRNRK